MDLKVVSFNIRCCDDPDGNSIAERAVRLSEVTSRYAADIICFQEQRPAWEPFLERYYAKEYDFFNKYRSDKEDVESSPIFWRKDKFVCIKTGYFWLSDTPNVQSRGWDERYNCFRMCVFAVLGSKSENKRFVVMNTHFGFGDGGQVKSARLIAERAAEFEGLPLFVTGDFNMQPDTVGYAAMVENFTDVNAATVNDLRDTYHGYTPQTVKNEHIDYLFVNERIMPLTQKIMDDTVNGKFPSDHFGLYSELKI